MDSHWKSLLQAVCEDPSNDAPRLIAADWLEERDDPRGEFIRVQCELAKPAWPCGGYYCDEEVGHIDCHDPTGERRQHLRERETELLAEHIREWFGASPWPNGKYRDVTLRAYYEFRRGFIDSIGTTHDLWCGTPCERCDGLGEMSRSIPHRLSECHACHGTGRLNAYGPEIVRQQPVMRVRLVDRKPYHSTTGNYYFFSGENRSESDICENLFSLMPNLNRPNAGPYTPEEAAHVALGDAALTWARREAGLPALEAAHRNS